MPIALPTPFPVGDVNVFLVKRDPPMLVDTGVKTPEAREALDQALAREGVAVSDIGVILLTHGHIDHMGLLAKLHEESGADVYAHPLVARQYGHLDEEGTAQERFLTETLTEFGAPTDVVEIVVGESKNFRTYGSNLDFTHPVHDGDIVEGFSVYHVPGHSPSDTLFVDETSRVAFSGDHILEAINPNPLLRRPRDGGPRPKSLPEYRASLRRTRALNLDICYPGHGDPIRDAKGVVDRLLAQQDRRSERVRTLLVDGMATPYEVCRGLYPDLAHELVYLGLSVAIGHLEILEEEGMAVAHLDQGVLRYQLTDANH
ncbi:MAG: MBL fold metallo-hydrolase [bacterium]|nr:MBL fold metallo-hydrolase [bacterium]